MSIWDKLSQKAPTPPPASNGDIWAKLKSPTPTKPAGVFSTVKLPTPIKSPYYATTTASGASVGFSDPEKDVSGRPFLAYRNPGDTSTTTDKTRTATTFDPTPVGSTVVSVVVLEIVEPFALDDHRQKGVSFILLASANYKELETSRRNVSKVQNRSIR